MRYPWVMEYTVRSGFVETPSTKASSVSTVEPGRRSFNVERGFGCGEGFVGGDGSGTSAWLEAATFGKWSRRAARLKLEGSDVRTGRLTVGSVEGLGGDDATEAVSGFSLPFLFISSVSSGEVAADRM